MASKDQYTITNILGTKKESCSMN